LDCEESEFAVLLELQILKARLFEEKCYDMRSSLELIGYPGQFSSGLLQLSQQLIQLGDHHCVLDQQITLVGLVIKIVSVSHLLVKLLGV